MVCPLPGPRADVAARLIARLICPDSSSGGTASDSALSQAFLASIEI